VLQQREFLFVYNAESNVLSKYIDIAHKIISPSTYSCSLCSITHGNFYEKKVWRDYRKSAAHKFRFQYKNDFLATLNENERLRFRFPVILEQEGDKLEVLLKPEELRSVESVEELIKVLEKKIN